MHSWSSHGTWTAGCYDPDAPNGTLMWYKPREITDYNGYGYEISYRHSAEATPSGEMNTWINEEPSSHLDVILERNIWTDHPWKAMGVGIDGNYAVVWFGEEEDSAGPVPTTDYMEGICAYACMSLSAKKPEYIPGETVEFVLKKGGPPGSSNLEGAYYEIEKEVNGEWKSYYKTDLEHWYFKTPVIESGGIAKLVTWD